MGACVGMLSQEIEEKTCANEGDPCSSFSNALGCCEGFTCYEETACIKANLAEDSLIQCITEAPLFDETKNEAALTRCANDAGYDDKNQCALKCTLEAIGVYWTAAASCIKREAPNSCITVECPAIVAAFDVPCLRRCSNSDILQ